MYFKQATALAVVLAGAANAEIGPYRGQNSNTLHHNDAAPNSHHHHHSYPHSGLGDRLRSVGDRISGVAHDAGRTARDAGHDASRSARNAGHDLSRNARGAANDVSRSARNAGNEAGYQANRAGDSIANAGRDTGREAKHQGRRFGNALHRGSNNVGAGTRHAGSDLRDAGHHIAQDVRAVGHHVADDVAAGARALKPTFLNRVDSLFTAEIIFALLVGVPLLFNIDGYRNIQSTISNLLGQSYNHAAVETCVAADNVVYKLLGGSIVAAGIRAFQGIRTNDSSYKRALLETDLTWSALTFAITLIARLTQDNSLYLPWTVASGIFLAWGLFQATHWDAAQNEIRDGDYRY
jgi:hypothetical protein